MSQCRKRCKRQLTKVARYFYHFLMGTLTQGRHPKLHTWRFCCWVSVLVMKQSGDVLQWSCAFSRGVHLKDLPACFFLIFPVGLLFCTVNSRSPCIWLSLFIWSERWQSRSTPDLRSSKTHLFSFFKKCERTRRMCVFVWESENTVRMSALFHLQTKRLYNARKSNSLEIPVIIFA